MSFLKLDIPELRKITGKEYCKDIGECSSGGGYGKFSCKCSDNKFWNFVKYKYTITMYLHSF
jgi:hypothetical protein